MQWSISDMVRARTFKHLPLCSELLKNLLVEIYWSSRNEGKPLSKLKHVFRKCSEVSLKLWMLEFLNLCHCVQHPWKLTNRNFWSTRNKRKPLSQLKHVFRKCSGVSQKWSMLELSNLCHYVQHPWEFTSRNYWSSRNERKPLSQQKCVLRKWGGVSQKWWLLELSNLCHCVQHPWKLSSRDFWSSIGMTRKPLSKQKHVFLRKCCRVFQKQWMLELWNHCHCVQHPRKLTSRDYWSSRNDMKATF